MIRRNSFTSPGYGSILFILSFFLSVAWNPQETAAARSGNQVSALLLCQEMDRALTQIESSYRPRDPGKDPFSMSVRRAVLALASLRSDLSRREKRLGSSIGEMASAVAEVSVTYRYCSVKDQKVRAGVVGLASAWDELQEHFVEKAGSSRSKFTDEQRRQLQELKAKSDEMDQRLRELQAKLASDARLSSEVRRMIEENRQITQANASTLGLMTAVTAFNALSGWWHGLYWTVSYHRGGWVSQFGPLDRWWSGTDAIFAPTYNTYFTNVDTAIFDDRWMADHPISITDEAALLRWEESDHSWNLYDPLENAGGFYLEEYDIRGAWPHNQRAHDGFHSLDRELSIDGPDHHGGGIENGLDLGIGGDDLDLDE